MLSRCLTVAIVGMLVPLPAAAAQAQPLKLATDSYYIRAREPGLQLFVRNKRPETMTTATPERIVLFVHGATYPAETTFDLQLDGLSWMDYIAERGYDVYLMDVRGYGRSTRPAEMNQPASENRPIVNTHVAMEDVGTVVEHILARRGVSRISLMAWSWGTVIAGAYTAENNDKVERLVLYAPAWLRQTPLSRADSPLGAYRTVTMDMARQRWLTDAPVDKQTELIPSGWFQAWWSANLEADPIGAKQDPPVVRAPNGAVEDGQRYWGADTRYYDPSTIRVPVLLVHAEWDAAATYMSQALFTRLTGAPLKRYAVIGQGTHMVMVERNRMQLFREVQLFLDEPR